MSTPSALRQLLERYDGDADALRAAVLVAAATVCTKKQRAVVEHFLEGREPSEIARLMGIGKSAVHQHLYGDHGKRGGHGGALKKLKAALLEGVVSKETVMGKKEVTSQDVLSWFARLPPSRHGLFGPLQVLLVAHCAVDARRQMKVADLQLYVPKPFVTAALSQLRATGFIDTDGITLTIKRTPLDDKETA